MTELRCDGVWLSNFKYEAESRRTQSMTQAAHCTLLGLTTISTTRTSQSHTAVLKSQYTIIWNQECDIDTDHRMACTQTHIQRNIVEVLQKYMYMHIALCISMAESAKEPWPYTWQERSHLSYASTIPMLHYTTNLQYISSATCRLYFLKTISSKMYMLVHEYKHIMSQWIRAHALTSKLDWLIAVKWIGSIRTYYFLLADINFDCIFIAQGLYKSITVLIHMRSHFQRSMLNGDHKNACSFYDNKHN